MIYQIQRSDYSAVKGKQRDREIGLRLKPGAIVGNTRLPRVCDDGGGKSTEEIQGPVRLLETPRSLFPSARLFSQVMARRYGHLELLLTLNNFPGLSASAGESEIISGWNFLYFTRPDRVDVQQRN